ncbi:type II toxin-antitoxin system VapC family toxin [Aerophototrophica crusticola]|uniref:Type II toxin-antitoxin system VapC family toxin n=1 Tax=Aerophototrophica crusticola TaxID=1709002 RepID=A0A858R7L7_9PROT|nr:type II toxin-antitoxin system VapC family toxin [Rhodospirillaceae bacterium B3]
MRRLRVTADTNILVRVITEDDPAQAAVARLMLDQAEIVSIPVPALCEMAWVLGRGYRLPAADIAAAIERLLEAGTVETDTPSVEAGLALLRQGGDFADGVIAFQGQQSGGVVFASFDRSAVRKLAASGIAAADPVELVEAGASRP